MPEVHAIARSVRVRIDTLPWIDLAARVQEKRLVRDVGDADA